MKERWDSFVEFVEGLFFLCVWTLAVAVFLKIFVAPIAPLITALLVTMFTIKTFMRPVTAILSVIGIALFASSWPATSAWGFIPGQLVWSAGVLLWFWAVLKSFIDPTPTPKKVLVSN